MNLIKAVKAGVKRALDFVERKSADKQKKQCAITLAAKKYDLNKICLQCGNMACDYYRYAKKHGFFPTVTDVDARASAATGEDIANIIEDCLSDDVTAGEDF